MTEFSDWRETPWGRGHGTDKAPHTCCLWTADGVCGVEEQRKRRAMLHPKVQ